MASCPTCIRSFAASVRYCPDDGTLLCAPSGAHELIGAVVLGAYRVTGVLGKGAAGVVFRARDDRMGRHVAVKVLRRELASCDSMRKRFAREARAAARISHPNIVKILDVGEVEGQPVLVMEHVAGRCLADLLAQHRLSPQRSVAIVRQIAAALAEAHACGVVHRDLKPANLMITQRRHTPDAVTILDFGVAKLLTGAMLDPAASSLTRDGEIFGTPDYIAPEQANGEDVDARSDVYSLGVVLYQMLTGRVPFRGPPVAVLLGHLGRAPAPPRSIDPHIDRALESVVLRCLEKRPQDRYGSADELVEALDACGSNDTSLPPPRVAVLERATANELSVVDEAPRYARGRGWTSRALAMTLLICLGVAGDRLAERWRLSAAGDVLADAATGLAQAVSVGHQARTQAAGPALASTRDRVQPRRSAEPRRTVVVAQAGYSLRVRLPETLVVGVDYELVLDAWDATGAVLEAPEMIVTIARPDGSARGIAAKPARASGKYRFRRTFWQRGRYQLQVFPPAGDATIRVFFDVGGAAPLAADPGQAGRDTGARQLL